MKRLLKTLRPGLLGRRMFFRHAASALTGYFMLPGRPGETIAQGAVNPISTAKNVIFILLTGAPHRWECCLL